MARTQDKKNKQENNSVLDKDAKDDHKKRDYSYTQNREVSWLRFNKRVLEEAFDESVPLFERLKFCSIFQSNLDEWFMIRVGGLSSLASLKKQPTDNKTGWTPKQQLENIFNTVPDLIRMHEDVFFKIEHALKKEGLIRVAPEDFTQKDTEFAREYFAQHLAPLLSPHVIDPRHPFPNLRNGVMYLAAELTDKQHESALGLVEIPSITPRVVKLPSNTSASQSKKEARIASNSSDAKADGTKARNLKAGVVTGETSQASQAKDKKKKSSELTNEKFRYALVEDIIALNIDSSFGNYTPLATSIVRITRNADLDPDGEGVAEEEDYRLHMIKVLKKRMRLEPVRAVFQGYVGERFEELIGEELNLGPERIQHLEMPLDLSYVFGLERYLSARQKAELFFKPFKPQETPMVDPQRSIKEQVLDHDVLLCYPYESMRPLLSLLREAVADENCISIRITLYRVAKESRLCENLIEAAEAGKDVTVLMELRARFDEENNIEWAERLEEAGCTVIYGFEGFKCHSKICLLTYHTAGKLQHITCLGTGNFNEKTARLYSDFMLLTAHKGIGEDGVKFFKNLMTGKLTGNYTYLGVAPIGLKPLIMEGIEREIARAKKGKDARIFFKMNSLTDRDIIDRLSEASRAGVSIVMVVRGICCILPGIKGKTKNIEVHQIVGRFLEHARIYAFGDKYDIIYLSSADMMTRNTERRVEIAYPILDETCKRTVVEYIRLQKKDNVKGRLLDAAGVWEKIRVKPDKPLINSQEVMLALAYLRNEANPEKSKLWKSAILESVPKAVLKRLLKVNAKYKGRGVGAQLELDAVVAEKYAPDFSDDMPAPIAQNALPAKPRAADGLSNELLDDVKPFVPKDIQIAEDTVEGDAFLEKAKTKILDNAETTGRLWSSDEIAALQEAPSKEEPSKVKRGLSLIKEGFKTLFG